MVGRDLGVISIVVVETLFLEHEGQCGMALMEVDLETE